MINITVKGHSACVTFTEPKEQTAISRFTKEKLTNYDYTRKLRQGGFKIKQSFFIYVPKKLYIHKNSAKDLETYLNVIGWFEIKTNYVKDWTPTKVKYTPLINIIPRPQQVEASKFINKDKDYNATLVELPPGGGKTITAIIEVLARSEKVMLLMRSEYLQQWEEELDKFIDLEEGDVFRIQGGSKLKKLIKESKEGTSSAKIITCSARTLQVYIKDFINKGGNSSYDISPDNFLEELNIPLVVNDEAHLDINFNFLFSSLFGPLEMLGLSGSYLTKDTIIQNIHRWLYPVENRFRVKKTDNHVTYVTCSYGLDNPGSVVTTIKGSNSYNHIAYEQYIMKVPYMKMRYYTLMWKMIESMYLDKREDDQKLLVFVSSIDMAKDFTDYLTSKMKDLSVGVYIGGSDYSEIIDNDVSVATLLKAGTALDIPGLITVINSVNVNSDTAVIQSFGRLRPIDDVMCTFVQLYCSDIPKHKAYQVNRNLILSSQWKYAVRIQSPIESI